VVDESVNLENPVPQILPLLPYAILECLHEYLLALDDRIILIRHAGRR
jgi:hypothetical protein